MKTELEARGNDLKAAWRDESLCAQLSEQDPSLANVWVSEDLVSEFTARRACRRCKVKIECLFSALADPDAEGWRAGFFFRDGKLSAEENRRLGAQYAVSATPRQRPSQPKAIES